MPLFMHIQSWVHISLQIASLHVVQNHPLCIYDMFWSTLGLISCANIEMACIHASVKVASNQLKSIAKDMSMRNDQWRTCANYFRSKFTIAFCLKSLVMQTIPQLQCLPKRSLQGIWNRHSTLQCTGEHLGLILSPADSSSALCLCANETVTTVVGCHLVFLCCSSWRLWTFDSTTHLSLPCGSSLPLDLTFWQRDSNCQVCRATQD